MEKVSRNAPCPCGSGKKYKNCHMKEQAAKEASNKSFIYMVIFVFILILGSIAYYFNSKPEPVAPQREKVWSEEHQHFH